MAARSPKKRAPAKKKVDPKAVSPETLERIREDIARWEPGKWARENNYGPACTCGLRTARGACHRHDADSDKRAV